MKNICKLCVFHSKYFNKTNLRSVGSVTLNFLPWNKTWSVFSGGKQNIASYEALRSLHVSAKKLEKSLESNNNIKDKNVNEVIYYGPLTAQIKGVKVFSCLSSLIGIVFQPFMIQNIINGEQLPLHIALCCCVGFFTFVTPFLIHLFTRKYVTEIRYNAATNAYTATTLSFFLQRVNIEFKIDDVAVPSILPLFTTMVIKKRPVFIISDSFLDVQHYIKMMKYDKPIDLKLNMSALNSKKVEEN